MRRLPALLLAATFAVALAGCVGSNGTVSMTAVDDAELADRASVGAAALESDPTFSLDPLAANASRGPPADPDPNETVALLGRDGRFYRVTDAPPDSHQSTNLISVYVDYEPSDGPYADEFGQPVSLSSLPAVDRRHVESLFERASAANRTRESERVDFRYESGPFLQSNLTEERALVVTRGDRAIGVAVEDRTSDVVPPEKRYDATLIAGNDRAFADYVRQHYLVDLTDVPPEVDELLRDARNGSVAETSTAINDLNARLPDHRTVDELDRGYGGGSYVVRYDGEIYWLHFRCCDGGL